MKKCNACGADNAVTAGVCAFCGTHFARSGYEASVEAGLKRLESEKLKFLSTSSVFSKFDPETVAAFEPTPETPPSENALSELSENPTQSDISMQDPPSHAPKENAVPTQDNLCVPPMDSVNIKKTETEIEAPETKPCESSKRDAIDPDCAEDDLDEILKSDIISEFSSIPEIESEIDSPFTTLKFAAVRTISVPEHRHRHRTETGMQAFCGEESEPAPRLLSGEASSSSQEMLAGTDDIIGESEETSAHDARALGENEAQTLTDEPLDDDANADNADDADNDAGEETRTQVRPSSDGAVMDGAVMDGAVMDAKNDHCKNDHCVDEPPPAPFQTSKIDAENWCDASSSIQDISCSDFMLVEDSDDEQEYASTIDSGATAERVREYLKQSIASGNPVSKQNLDLNSASYIEDHSQKESVTMQAKILKPASLAARHAAAIPSNSDDDSTITAIEKLKKIGVFNPVQHAEVHQSIMAAKSSAPGATANAIDEILPPSKVESIDFARSDIGTLPNVHYDASSTEFDDEDKTYNQSPEAIDEIQYMAKLANAAQGLPAPKGTNAPQVLPTQNAFDLDLDNRKTIPLEAAPNLAKLKKRHSKSTSAVLSPEIKPDDEKPNDENTESKLAKVIWSLVILVLLGCIGVLLYLMGILSFISPALAPKASAPMASIHVEAAEPTPFEIRQSVARAAFQFGIIADTQTWLDGWVNDTAATLSPEQRAPLLDMILDMHPMEMAHWQMRIRDLIAAGEFETARQKLRQLLDAPAPTPAGSPEWTELLYETFANDPHFIQPPQGISENDFDEIAPLGGGSTLTFKFRKDGQNVGAFKPNQTRLQSNYRAEIAAWRLCELLNCDFDIPWNRAVKIDKRTFNTLYNRSKSAKRESYRAEMKDLIWQASDGKEAVFGTLKDWVAKFTRFPIEYTSLWKPWLSQTDFKENFSTLKSDLAPLKKLSHTAKLYDEILALSQQLDTKGLAKQIAQVLTFDYLIGNWDRFSGVKQWWGVNCQFADGKIVSIDNGAAFPSYANEKVLERFMLVERFDKNFIQSLRMLNKEKTLSLLFPDASEKEKQSFEQFWSQRAAVLNRIDTLSEQYGTERVLSF